MKAEGTLYRTTITTPLGEMLAMGGEKGLGGLWFLGQRHFPDGWEKIPVMDGAELFLALRRELDEYFSNMRRLFSIPLAPSGTSFRQRVWSQLLQIPAGATKSYGDLARELSSAGAVTSPRAVGGAVGHNPISILIPCHRVVGAGGSLTGYAGGLDRKEALLRLESAR